MSVKVVSLGDCLLRESDVDLLKGPHWLNDNVISFYFEYLTLHKYKQNKISLFIGPEVTHCLKAASKDELSIFLDPVNAREKRIIFFAFNDEKTFEKCGGTHWSLLILSVCDMTIFHADSMTGTNFHQAAKFAGKLWNYFSSSGKGDFEEIACLQQDNYYDCGVFVLCHAEYFMDCFLQKKNITECSVMSREKTDMKRQELLRLIDKLVSC